MKQKTSKEYAYELLTELFPIKQSNLVRTSFLLKETDTKIEDFRLYFYRVFNEENYNEIDFSKTGISSIFYWYAIEKISQEYVEYFPRNKNLTERIIIEDRVDPPMFKLKSDNALSSYEEISLKFLEDIKETISKISLEKQTKLLKWTIKQIFSDIIYNYYTLNKKELFPNTLISISGENIKIFDINEEELGNILNIKFDKLEEVGIFSNL